MKIGVLSDTHINSLAEGMNLAEKLLAGPFTGVEAIFHAGDLVIEELESCFYPIPWFGVRGNMDPARIALPERRVVEVAGKRFGLIHGWGAPPGIEQRVMSAFATEPLDALIFGHSHEPICKRVGSLLLMNPGSSTDRRYAPQHSVGLLTIDHEICGEIVTIDR